jgi:hypothetical protein
VETPADRRTWIDDYIEGRTFGSGLSVWAYPALSVKDVALHEALDSFVVGLNLSTVLAAYAACEIWLVEVIVSRDSLAGASDAGMIRESVIEAWKKAVEKHGDITRTKEILKQSRMLGHWMAPELRNRIIQLGRNKNDLAHYLPVGIAEVRETSATSWIGHLTPPPPVDPSVRREYAEHAIKTMLDLWFARQWSFPPGQCPADDWVPPAI